MRSPDWAPRLALLARERALMPFAWGRNDCCLFAADAVLAMTGVDHAKAFRGYENEFGALRLIQRAGGLRQIATAALGEPVDVTMAAVGDVVLMLNDGRELLAVCNGTAALSPGEKGLVAHPMADALACWKV